MVNRFIIIVILVPVAIALIALAVANRAPVSFTLDPFNPGNPALTVTQPLFALLFAALVLGLLIGGIATWLNQGRYRKLARQRSHEIESLRKSAARRPPQVPLPDLPRQGA
jgi:uncharacterized integral membrane protein